MVRSLWRVRSDDETIEERDYLGDNPNFFSLKIHHGGFFTKQPTLSYSGGKVNYVDMIDCDLFSVEDVDQMLKDLGYVDDQPKWYHFKNPGSSLDFVIQALDSDEDVRCLLKYVSKVKVIELYIEHWSESDGSGNMPEVIDDGNGDRPEIRCVEGNGSGDRFELEESQDSDNDSDVSEFIVDDENIINEVEVDMSTFNLMIDKDVEWIGCKEAPDTEAPKSQVNMSALDEQPIDLETFDSGSDDDVCAARRSVIRKLATDQSVQSSKIDTTVNFYVGQTFASKSEVKEMVVLHAVQTRRQLHFIYNDNRRLRIICRGNIPLFSSPSPNTKGPKSVKESVTSGPKTDGPGVEFIPVQRKWTKSGIIELTSPKKGGKEDVSGGKTSQHFEKEGGSQKGKKTEQDSISCPWVLHVSKFREEDTWMVKTFNDVHRCLQTRAVAKCTGVFLSKELENHITPDAEVPVKAVRDQLQKKYEMDISRQKIYRAKKLAKEKVQGDYIAQYPLLRNYILELQQTNPDTTVKLQFEEATDPASHQVQFKRIYVCLGALKRGFRVGGRELLGLDGCHMKGSFPGQILTAVGIDPNNGTYPVAYGIVESENTDSWTWFLSCLGDDLELHTMSNFTFISDRQKGVIPAIAKLFPCAEHRYCLRHIYENMRSSYRGELYKKHLWKCATATTINQFDSNMNDLRALNSEAYAWLKDIPAVHWARSHFTGRAHCDMLLNNICEVFNRRLVDGRDKPIITCLDFIREYLMKRIVLVQKQIEKHDGPLTPNATILFNIIKKNASQVKVIWNGGNRFQVTGKSDDQCVVDINARTCTCRKWELTGIPCKHAVAAIWDMALNGNEAGIPESYVHRCYWLTTWKTMYGFKIGPVNGMQLWPISPCTLTIVPPKHRVQIGRPKKNRRPSAEELSNKMVKGGKLSRAGGTTTCSKCKGRGHNSRGCKEILQSSVGSSSQPASQVDSQSAASGARKKRQSKAPSKTAVKKRRTCGKGKADV